MEQQKLIAELSSLIAGSDNIVFFGGAGVSTESNIPDFRSEQGLYNATSKYGYAPETMLSHSFFLDHPKEFFEYHLNEMIFEHAKPNDAHIALARLEQLGKLKAVITQNIDGLHQAAGSKNVLELHGSVLRNYCLNCGARYALDFMLEHRRQIPHCPDCGGVVRPDVVLYEEGLDDRVLRAAVKYISEAELLIVGGTSLVVYPAAGLIDYFRGRHLVLINKGATSYDGRAGLVIRDSIGKTLAAALKSI
ncbi:MAG: NAD-dependent protein deacylase [Bacillota bacterium]|nr:NAD-dependent protein deacylase [Bacillota bacterium]